MQIPTQLPSVIAPRCGNITRDESNRTGNEHGLTTNPVGKHGGKRNRNQAEVLRRPASKSAWCCGQARNPLVAKESRVRS